MASDGDASRRSSRAATAIAGVVGALMLTFVIGAVLAAIVALQSPDERRTAEDQDRTSVAPEPEDLDEPSSTTAEVSAADRIARDRQVEVAREANQHLAVAADAEAAGFAVVPTPEPRRLVHLVDWDRVDASFDPAAPEMVVVDSEAVDRQVVALGYFVVGAEPPEGFAGAGEEWVEEPSLCGAAPAARPACPDPASTGWVLHLWVMGEDNPGGAFAFENPRYVD